MKKIFLPFLFLLFAVVAQAQSAIPVKNNDAARLNRTYQLATDPTKWDDLDKLMVRSGLVVFQPSTNLVRRGLNASKGSTCTLGSLYTATDTAHIFFCPAGTWVDLGTGAGGGGTVTSVSVTTANGVSGSVANATTAPAITLTLGAITPTTVNGNTFTAGTYTVTGGSGKVFTFNNTLTITNTDGITATFPTTSFTAARTDLGQTFSGANTFTGTASDVSLTVSGTQPAAVSSGNGTAATTAMVVSAPAGGDTSGTGANARGGNGATVTVTGGNGGQQTGASSGTARGGTGGSLTYTAGNGGNATAVTGTIAGGGAGTINFTGGTGGTSATSTGGAGGGGTMAGGVGGVTTAAAVSGAGGSYTITGGAGGANSNAAGTSGAGGGIIIDAGAAGTASGGATTGNNGSMLIGGTNATAVTIGNATGKVVLFGTKAADSAASGQYGEIISSLVAIGSPVSLTSATAANITSISLTAGDWDVEGNCNFKATTATVTATQCGISSTSATLPVDGSEVYSGVQVTVISENDSVTLPRKRISISATTTVYMVGQSTFSAGTVGGFGAMTARRVR